jgi:hypothetical protein
VDIFGRVVFSENITSGEIVDKARTADHFLRLREEEEETFRDESRWTIGGGEERSAEDGEAVWWSKGEDTNKC